MSPQERMGLTEQTRHALAHELRDLLEGGAPEQPIERLKQLMLSLDAYRREISVAITRHANEERVLADEVDQREKAVARWQHRLELARGSGDAALVATAESELEREVARREDWAARHRLLTRAIAGLENNRRLVEQTLRVVRRKKQALSSGPARGDGQAAGEAGAAQERHRREFAAAALLAEGMTQGQRREPPPAAEDPVEAAFRALELQEIAGRFRPPDGRARPEE